MSLLFTPIRENESDCLALFNLKSEKNDMYWAGYKTSPNFASFSGWYSKQLLRSDRRIWLVRKITQPQQVIGYLYVTFERESDQQVAVLSHGVSELQIGQGYGTQIINFAVNYWLNHMVNQAEAVSAWIVQENKASIKTFVRNGFVVSDQVKHVFYSSFDRELLMLNFYFTYPRTA